MVEKLLKGIITQKEALIYYNANITYKTLPVGINGFVISYKGINNIIVNKNLSYYRKRKTIIHELIHLELNHLGKMRDCLELDCAIYEYETDRYLEMLEKYIYETRKYEVIEVI